jgi:hypothetical protein
VTVQIRGDNQALRLDPPVTELTMAEAIDLARDLIDAVTQCGFEVKMDVEVKRHTPTDQQLQTALRRVWHVRKAAQEQAWPDERLNQELVSRVLEACL